MSARSKPLSVLLLGALLPSALLLSGCTSGDSDDAATASSAAGGDSAGLAAPETAAEAAPGKPQPAPDRDAAIDARVQPGDAVIRTADLEVEVEDLRRSAERAGQIARNAGGRVAGEERSGSDEDGSAMLQLRVPPAEFDGAVGDLAALGTERGRRLGTEDVTDAVVDLEARLNTQRASVARVTALLSEATNLGEVVQIEGELTRRTADLESLEARLAALEGQVELSTITIRLWTAGDEPADDGALGFGDGLRNGWDAVITVARVVAVTAGALLPFLPLFLLAGLFVVRARRSQAIHPD